MYLGEFLEYTQGVSSLSATQFTVENSVFSDSQPLTAIVFVVQIQTFHEISQREKHFWRT